MKSAEEIADEAMSKGSMGLLPRPHVVAAVRAAQIDAAEWMREEAAKMADRAYPPDNKPWHIARAIRSIKLPEAR